MDTRTATAIEGLERKLAELDLTDDEAMVLSELVARAASVDADEVSGFALGVITAPGPGGGPHIVVGADAGGGPHIRAGGGIEIGPAVLGFRVGG